MASIVQTITLAPAFMQEIKEDDRRLNQLMSDFRQFVARGAPTHSEALQLASLVLDVRGRVAFHFALEEAYGYFEDPVAVAPRLCERVDGLRAEHGELFEEISRIVEMFEDSEPDLPADIANVQEMCRGFLSRFDAHEAAENALIAQAFNEDIGVGD